MVTGGSRGKFGDHVVKKTTGRHRLIAEKRIKDYIIELEGQSAKIEVLNNELESLKKKLSPTISRDSIRIKTQIITKTRELKAAEKQAQLFLEKYNEAISHNTSVLNKKPSFNLRLHKPKKPGKSVDK